MSWTVRWDEAAGRELSKLDKPVRQRIAAAIRKLAEDPRGNSTTKLVTSVDLWRLRVGDYRVVYAILDDELVIVVVRVAHRSKSYRGQK